MPLWLESVAPVLPESFQALTLVCHVILELCRPTKSVVHRRFGPFSWFRAKTLPRQDFLRCFSDSEYSCESIPGGAPSRCRAGSSISTRFYIWSFSRRRRAYGECQKYGIPGFEDVRNYVDLTQMFQCEKKAYVARNRFIRSKKSHEMTMKTSKTAIE